VGFGFFLIFQDMMVVVATYNIHACGGVDGRFDPQRVAEVIRELDADIIALQEVDAQHRIAGYVDQWAFLAAATGHHYTAGISLRTHRRNFGNALFTRQPVERVRLHDISFSTREPRGAIDAVVVADGHRLRVIATHFGLKRAERRHQAARLSTFLADEPPETAATLVLADLNEWRTTSRTLNAILRQFHPSPAPKSFPSRRPIFALDRVLAAGDARLAEVAAHRSERARLASDHLPVRGVLTWSERPVQP
jgi:endonuclease/exonuclease/phosphatase family metal-dependent hydrolase